MPAGMRGALPDREQVQGGPGELSCELGNGWRGDCYEEPPPRRKATGAQKAGEAHLRSWRPRWAPGRLVRRPSSGRARGGRVRRARAAANTALARSEFRAAAEGPTWTRTPVGASAGLVSGLFTGWTGWGERAPWLAPLIEWGCFAPGGGGFAVVCAAEPGTAGAADLAERGCGAGQQGGDRDAADWARLAEERAAAEDWREAVHCLFWAAIALMEGRRAWRAERDPDAPGVRAVAEARDRRHRALARADAQLLSASGTACARRIEAEYEAALAASAGAGIGKAGAVSRTWRLGDPVAAAGGGVMAATRPGGGESGSAADAVAGRGCAADHRGGERDCAGDGQTRPAALEL